MEDELTRDQCSVESLHSSSTSPALSCNPTPGLNLIPALIAAPLSAPTPTPVPIDKLFKKFMKAYLESNQGPRQHLAEREQTLKAKV